MICLKIKLLFEFKSDFVDSFFPKKTLFPTYNLYGAGLILTAFFEVSALEALTSVIHDEQFDEIE